MLWPFLSVDNFFNNPDEIVEYSKKLEYKSNFYPGLRTDSLHLIDPDFFLWINQKILSVLYPNEYTNLFFRSGTHFQRVKPGLEHDGWVHKDDCEFTCIVYLSKQEHCGTTIFTPKEPHLTYNDQEEKVKYFQNPTGYSDLEKLKNAKAANNNKFDDSIIVKSRYNRMIIFDASMYHAADPYIGSDDQEDRLTLISFFHGVQFKAGESNLRFPLSQMRRI